ncbi:hypothetical protein C8F01DRAFT_95343 [Mycena amicta]|nr:hypothetical protein C8F01DRAFT_95343 [Mycena amicta]
MKGFVHEVLRRSRTSDSVLQTTLCYLEAIRLQVPELVSKEQSEEGTYMQYESKSRVMPATPTELALEAESSKPEAAQAANADVPRLSVCALTRRRVQAHWQTLGES